MKKILPYILASVGFAACKGGLPKSLDKTTTKQFWAMNVKQALPVDTTSFTHNFEELLYNNSIVITEGDSIKMGSYADGMIVDANDKPLVQLHYSKSTINDVNITPFDAKATEHFDIQILNGEFNNRLTIDKRYKQSDTLVLHHIY